MSVQGVFQRITAALERAGIRYMVTGSFASAHYGSPRSTQDIDLVIEATPAQLESFVGELPATEYYVELDAAQRAHQEQSLFNAIDLAAGWKIDFIIRKSRAFSQEEFRRRQQVSLHGVSLYMATAEDSIISKLEWAKLGQSQRQVQDVSAILRVQWNDLDHAYLEKWIDWLELQNEWKAACRVAGMG